MFVESPFRENPIHPASDHAGTSSGVQLAKPFLKWVGGKTQLIEQLDSNVPPELRDGQISRYIEPFVGGGSFFFHIAQKYSLKDLIISDSNQDLILAYWTIKDRVDVLVNELQDIQQRYLSLSDESKREEYYYKTRTLFNKQKSDLNLQTYSEDWVKRTAQLIFLNKTCFNGLFRVNASGLFNVAFGKYTNPKICDPNNLEAVSKILETTQILLGDFSCVLEHVDADSFVYLDPPYRPISSTSNFTGYSPGTFTPEDQERLAKFCQHADDLGAKLMISNSDPNNIVSEDTYFEDLYPGYQIKRAMANRMVNCKADKRGKISELIIMNYPKISAASEQPNSSATGAPTRRTGAALAAFKLFSSCAERDRNFELDELQKVTGWKSQTARTYVSKKWKEYLEPVEGAKATFAVKKTFLRHTEDSFLSEFSQVLANVSKPESVEDARKQVITALNVYADMLAQSNSFATEKKIRDMMRDV